ncbi:MAG TPA: 4Fe-4S dicluster domain-containing protein [Candidatus Glassbacteria bacterium]|nr:4Fe-4S dicluster domain-containing protein [Candidatus Glassbacteria bacterium]
MDTHSPSIIIDYAKCLPCSGLICIGVCPVGIIEQGEEQKPTIMGFSSCTKCGVCINLCPTKAITLPQSKDK